MRNLQCPQCGISRFYVRNESGDSVLVNVDEKLTIIPVHVEDSLTGFDLSLLYCLGCSWQGSPKSLNNGRHT